MLQVEWSPPLEPNGKITYNVCFNDVCVTEELLSKTITGLAPEKMIVVNVSAFTSKGEGPETSMTVTTSPGKV